MKKSTNQGVCIARHITGMVCRYLMMPLVRECMISGTTDAMITASICFGSIPRCSSMPQIVIPYSSEVRCRFVVMRNMPGRNSVKHPHCDIRISHIDHKQHSFPTLTFLPTWVLHIFLHVCISQQSKKGGVNAFARISIQHMYRGYRSQ